MSLEAALDEEREQVMALLEGRSPHRRAGSFAAPSAPTMPVKSMLDVDPPGTSGTAAPGQRPPMPRQSSTSPRLTSASPVAGSKVDQYRFDVLPSIESRSSVPKRVTQGPGFSLAGFGQQRNRRLSSNSSSNGRRMFGLELPKQNVGRSISPRPLDTPLLSPGPANFVPGERRASLGETAGVSKPQERAPTVADTKKLATLMRTGYDHATGTSIAPDGSVRLEHDPAYHDDDDDDSDTDSDDDTDTDNDDDDDSDDDDDDDADDDDSTDSECARGRKRTGTISNEQSRLALSRGSSRTSPKKTKSKSPPNSQPQYRSLLDPDDSSTTPATTLASNTSFNTGKKRVKKKVSPFFQTAYVNVDDEGETLDPFDSEAEEAMRDLQEAQAMNMHFSDIVHTPGSPRCVHQIIRGNYGLMQEQVSRGERRQRMYIVATDLSEEAKYALEWAIGTVVRDGDTLLAVYAMDDPGGGDVSGMRLAGDLGGIVRMLGGIDLREGRSSRRSSASNSRSGSRTHSAARSRTRSRTGSILNKATRGAFSSVSQPSSPGPSPLSRSVSREAKERDYYFGTGTAELDKDDGAGGADQFDPPSSDVSPTSVSSSGPKLHESSLKIDMEGLPLQSSLASEGAEKVVDKSVDGIARLTSGMKALEERDRNLHPIPDNFDQMTALEQERWKATAEISKRCAKLLRNTKLQVRVLVEVFHCKTPKRMITDVIDLLEPTLVILGSRGRSSLKGVLLGSFSNYLVTKSSIPVMVVRKRLRKQGGKKEQRKVGTYSGHQINPRHRNLLNPHGRLADAKID